MFILTALRFTKFKSTKTKLSLYILLSHLVFSQCCAVGQKCTIALLASSVEQELSWSQCGVAVY